MALGSTGRPFIPTQRSIKLFLLPQIFFYSTSSCLKQIDFIKGQIKAFVEWGRQVREQLDHRKSFLPVVIKIVPLLPLMIGVIWPFIKIEQTNYNYLFSFIMLTFHCILYIFPDCILNYCIILLYVLFNFILLSTLLFYLYLYLSTCFHSCCISILLCTEYLKQKTISSWGLMQYSDFDSDELF